MNKRIKAMEQVERASKMAINKPGFHFCAPYGWLNDPNGFSKFNGNYHLFYQYNPYDVVWGPMYWGNAKSKDLIKWEHLPIAMAPDQTYDAQGCFSGSAIVAGDKLWLMYTGHLDGNTDGTRNPELVRENQNMAWSRDGVNFEKYENNPVLFEGHLPESAEPGDFRDPKIYKKGDAYYSVIVSRDSNEGGQALLYTSKDLLNWEFFSTLAQSKNTIGTMWECPDFFSLEDQDILLISTMHEDAAQGPRHGNLCLIGKMDYDSRNFVWDKTQVLDLGFSFYAPQTMIDEDGRRLLIAWLHSWGAKPFSARFGWTGMMTVPRELTLVDGQVRQHPVEEIKNYRQTGTSYKNIVLDGEMSLEGIEGKQIDFMANVDLQDADSFQIDFRKNKRCKTVLRYERATGELIFDISDDGQDRDERQSVEKWNFIKRHKIEVTDNILQVRALIDRYSIEIFVNDGRYVLTSTIVPEEDADGIVFFSEGEVKALDLACYRIDLDQSPDKLASAAGGRRVEQCLS